MCAPSLLSESWRRNTMPFELASVLLLQVSDIREYLYWPFVDRVHSNGFWAQITLFCNSASDEFCHSFSTLSIIESKSASELT